MAGEEKTGDRGASETSLLDLFGHPFHKLRIDPSATNEKVDGAIDLARERQTASNEELAALREALFSPSGRLLQDLSYPIDGSADHVEAIYTTLSSEASTSQWLSFAQQLPQLSKAAFLAHVAANRSAECAVLRALIESHAALDPTYAFEILRELRRAAGNPPPSLVSVTEGLQQLVARRCQAVIGVLMRHEDIADTLLECGQQVLDQGERHQIDVLACLVGIYHQSTLQRQLEQLEAIKSACRTMSARPTPDASQELAQNLADWESRCGPILMLADHRDIFAHFKSPLDDILTLTRTLSADHRYELALEVTELSREILSPSPTAVKRLAESKRLTEDELVAREMKPLEEFIDRFESNFGSLIQCLKVNGFSSSSVGAAKDLWDLFAQAAKATDRVRSVEPWMLVRDLAMHLSDNAEQPLAAFALIVGLIHQAKTVSAPPSLVSSFQQDLRAIRDAQRAGDSRPKETGRKRLIWSAGVAFVAVCGAALYLGFEAGDRHRLKSAPLTTPRVINPEIEPPVGTGQQFSIANVRYCRFQEERLRIMKSLVRGAEDTRAFNLLAVDYNSRCSDFFFRDSDVAAVNREVASNRQQLANEAEKIMSTWAGHGAVPLSSTK
jgi:hypothetical protein